MCPSSSSLVMRILIVRFQLAASSKAMPGCYDYSIRVPAVSLSLRCVATDKLSVIIRYKQFSLQFYTILMAHADDLQAVSVDEALVDVTSSVARIRTELAERSEPAEEPSDPAKDFAEAIRAQVRKITGCEGMHFVHFPADTIITSGDSEHWDSKQHHVGTTRLSTCKAGRVLPPPCGGRGGVSCATRHRSVTWFWVRRAAEGS